MSETLNPPLNIRRLSFDDAELLMRLGRETFYDTFTGTCTEEDMAGFLDETFHPQQVQAELTDSDDFFYVAEVDGEALGYLRYKEDYRSFPYMRRWKALEIKRIYVRKAFHGRDVGRVLLEFAMEQASQGNYEVVWLGVWEYNLRARRFYEKHGFSASGHTHDFPIGSTPQTDLWYWRFF
jgi:ribosomal protein S18 acetylase RimI-like enzyme